MVSIVFENPIKHIGKILKLYATEIVGRFVRGT